MDGGEDEDQDDDGELDAEGDEPAIDRPKTRAELNQLRDRFENNRHVACFFYKDRGLQLEMRVLYLGGRHLAHEFSEALRVQKQGQATKLQIQSALKAPLPKPNLQQMTYKLHELCDIIIVSVIIIIIHLLLIPITIIITTAAVIISGSSRRSSSRRRRRRRRRRSKGGLLATAVATGCQGCWAQG